VRERPLGRLLLIDRKILSALVMIVIATHFDVTVAYLADDAARIDVWRMIRRRAAAAGIDAEMCCHTFRATGLTNFLANGGTLENAQAMADHASPRTTQLYDRTGDEVTLGRAYCDLIARNTRTKGAHGWQCHP
jgi:integrase